MEVSAGLGRSRLCHRAAQRRGTALIWAVSTLGLVVGFVSLAVDYGRVRMVKTELQRAADATALGTMEAYEDSGYSTAAATAAAMQMLAANTCDSGSGITPTLGLVGGTWNTTTRTFSPAYAPGYAAVQVTLSRTQANSNPIKLNFAAVLGIKTFDLKASATAIAFDYATVPVAVPSTANLYLSGMSGGSSTELGDTTSSAPPYQVAAIPVVPGTWITLTSPSGTSSILPGYTPFVDAAGDATRPLHHNENYDHSDWGIGSENGIADAVMPADAIAGLFLGPAAPNLSSAPAGVDWTSASVKDQPTYGNLAIQQPFLIGNGKTSSGTVKRFQVPPGATRLYMSVWDGTVQSNNGGSITATLNRPISIRLVK